MDIFDLLKEVVKGVVRAITAHLLQKHILDKENATQRRRKHEGGTRKK